MGASGAGCGSRGVWAFGSGPDGNIAGCEIDNRGHNEKRRYAAWALFEQDLVLALDHLKPTDAAPDIDTGALCLLRVRVNFETGLNDGELRRGDRELDESPHLFYFLLFDVQQRIEVFHLTS